MTLLSLWPDHSPPSDPGHGDKAGHLAAYAALMAAAVVWRPHRPLLLALGLAAFGLALEALQGFVPGRTPSLSDGAANLAGLAAGFAAGHLFLKALAGPR